MKTDKFWEEYGVVQANSAALLSKAYSLRYQCYCVENEYENKNSLEIENDNFDLFSAHGLLFRKQDNIFFGNVRLIKPIHRKFPIEFFVDINKYVDKNSSLEISRFCLSKDLRKQINQKQYEALYVLSLIKWIVNYALLNHYEYLLAIVEPSLIRVLKKHSIEFNVLGEKVNYHGVRYPCCIVLNKLLEEVRQKKPEIFEFMLL